MEAAIDNPDPAQQLADEIRADLARGQYHPRERLIESDLVARYGYPRATARAALVQLATEGLVERTPHRGATVRSLSIDEAIELAQVRRELEALCALHAAAKADGAQHEQFAASVQAMRHAADSGDMHSYRHASISFHERIIAAADHDSARRQLAAIRHHNLQQHFPLAFQAGEFSDSLDDHVAVGEAIVAKDPVRAEQAMRLHVDRIVQLLEAHREILQNQ